MHVAMAAHLEASAPGSSGAPRGASGSGEQCAPLPMPECLLAVQVCWPWKHRLVRPALRGVYSSKHTGSTQLS